MEFHRKYKSQSAYSSWLALAAAILLHAVILLLPLSRQAPEAEDFPAQIELRLTSYTTPSPVPEAPDQPTETPPTTALDETDERLADSEPVMKEPAPAVSPPAEEPDKDIRPPIEARKPASASSILAAQFITEESEADRIFGKPFGQDSAEPRREFHYPARPDLISMLDQPMPELPFAYTPGLVRFAYEPGLKGDLQRFWDVITPEFGWKTDNGTEFRCIWLLVVAGCGWK